MLKEIALTSQSWTASRRDSLPDGRGHQHFRPSAAAWRLLPREKRASCWRRSAVMPYRESVIVVTKSRRRLKKEDRAIPDRDRPWCRQPWQVSIVILATPALEANVNAARS